MSRFEWKTSRFGPLPKLVYSGFFNYISTGHLPPMSVVSQWNRAVDTANKFREVATRMGVCDGLLVCLATGREMVSEEDFERAVSSVHTRGGLPGPGHRGQLATCQQVRLRYSIGESNFGITEVEVKRIVLRCPAPDCTHRLWKTKLLTGMWENGIRPYVFGNEQDDVPINLLTGRHIDPAMERCQDEPLDLSQGPASPTGTLRKGAAISEYIPDMMSRSEWPAQQKHLLSADPMVNIHDLQINAPHLADSSGVRTSLGGLKRKAPKANRSRNTKARGCSEGMVYGDDNETNRKSYASQLKSHRCTTDIDRHPLSPKKEDCIEYQEQESYVRKVKMSDNFWWELKVTQSPSPSKKRKEYTTWQPQFWPRTSLSHIEAAMGPQSLFHKGAEAQTSPILQSSHAKCTPQTASVSPTMKSVSTGQYPAKSSARPSMPPALGKTQRALIIDRAKDRAVTKVQAADITWSGISSRQTTQLSKTPDLSLPLTLDMPSIDRSPQKITRYVKVGSIVPRRESPVSGSLTNISKATTPVTLLPPKRTAPDSMQCFQSHFEQGGAISVPPPASYDVCTEKKAVMLDKPTIPSQASPSFIKQAIASSEPIDATRLWSKLDNAIKRILSDLPDSDPEYSEEDVSTIAIQSLSNNVSADFSPDVIQRKKDEVIVIDSSNSSSSSVGGSVTHKACSKGYEAQYMDMDDIIEQVVQKLTTQSVDKVHVKAGSITANRDTGARKKLFESAEKIEVAVCNKVGICARKKAGHRSVTRNVDVDIRKETDIDACTSGNIDGWNQRDVEKSTKLDIYASKKGDVDANEEEEVDGSKKTELSDSMAILEMLEGEATDQTPPTVGLTQLWFTELQEVIGSMRADIWMLMTNQDSCTKRLKQKIEMGLDIIAEVRGAAMDTK